MTAHEFTIIASGLDPNADDFEDRFFAAGCDDATIVFQRGAIILEFHRQAETLADALSSAIADVRAAGAAVDRVEPDYLVSLTDIAKRAKLTRAAVSLYGRGERGAAFPAPVARITSDSPLYDWPEVAAWLYDRHQIDRDTVLAARLLKEASLGVSDRCDNDNVVCRLHDAERAFLSA